ncbi:reverse transcriptase domain-containing protein [Tanacetum coccineum]
MRELRRKLFKGTDDKDAYEHVRRVLEIADLFHFPGVTHNATMLRVLPITLKGPALRWINRLSAGLVTTWDLLEKAFIKQYCPPFKTAKKLEIIQNFKQEMDETFGLDIPTRRVLDSKGFIPLLTQTQALISILVMVARYHWYDETTTREEINDSPNNIDTQKPKENIHVIQASFKNCKEAHLTMEYPIEFCENSITKQAEEDEWIRKFIENTSSNIKELKTTTRNLRERAYQLTQTILMNTCEKFKERTTMGKENVKEPVPRDLPGQFLSNPYRTRETICAIRISKEIKEDVVDLNDGCDITIEDVESHRKILTPSIHALPNLKPIVQPYMPLGLVYNKEEVVREEEHDHDIPLQDHVIQPLTP